MDFSRLEATVRTRVSFVHVALVACRSRVTGVASGGALRCNRPGYVRCKATIFSRFLKFWRTPFMVHVFVGGVDVSLLRFSPRGSLSRLWRCADGSPASALGPPSLAAWPRRVLARILLSSRTLVLMAVQALARRHLPQPARRRRRAASNVYAVPILEYGILILHVV